MGMAGLIVAGIVGYLFGRNAAVSPPTFHQLTFDRGLIYSARFAAGATLFHESEQSRIARAELPAFGFV